MRSRKTKNNQEERLVIIILEQGYCEREIIIRSNTNKGITMNLATATIMMIVVVGVTLIVMILMIPVTSSCGCLYY